MAALLIGHDWLNGMTTRMSSKFGSRKKIKDFRSRQAEIKNFGARTAQDPITLRELKKIFDHKDLFADYGLIVMEQEKHNSVILEINLRVEGSKRICLLLVRGHNTYISSPGDFWCTSCKTMVASKQQHVCN